MEVGVTTVGEGQRDKAKVKSDEDPRFIHFVQ